MSHCVSLCLCHDFSTFFYDGGLKRPDHDRSTIIQPIVGEGSACSAPTNLHVVHAPCICPSDSPWLQPEGLQQLQEDRVAPFEWPTSASLDPSVLAKDVDKEALRHAR